MHPIQILLVEDNPGDIRLMQEAFLESKLRNTLNVVRTGKEALAFLRRQPPFETVPEPDLIVLDLNLPGIDGREVLSILKGDARLRHIPVAVMTSSGAEEDIQHAYRVHANCYIRKPLDMESFLTVVQSINNFWFTIVTLPPKR